MAEAERLWCSSTKRLYQQRLKAPAPGLTSPGVGGSDGAAPPAQGHAADTLPLLSLRLAVRERLYQRWVQHFQRQDDAASQRMLLWLKTAHLMAGPGRLLASDALKTLADTTRDPIAYGLWLQAGRYCFQSAHCTAEDRLRWIERDPDNLMAWLPERTDRSPMTPARWQGLAQAEALRDPVRELASHLLPLVPIEPGLEMEIALEDLQHMLRVSPFTDPAQRLVDVCTQAIAPEQVQACVHAAAVLARQPAPSQDDRLIAEAIHQHFTQAADGMALRAQVQRALQTLPHRHPALSASSEQPGCDHLPAWRERLQRLVAVDRAPMPQPLAPPH